MDNNSNSVSSPTGFATRQHSALSQDVGSLFNKDVFSDLVLVLGETRIKVHKNLLAARSDYFRSLLTNGMKETTKAEIPIEDESNVELFDKLLRYVYSGEMQCDETSETIDMLIMADKYRFEELHKSIETYLESILSTSNFWLIYSGAYVCSPSLMAKCLHMIDLKPTEILKAEGLSSLDVRAFNEIIRRDTFHPTQPDLFDAISKWIEGNNKDKDASLLLSNIRLEEMPLGFLLETVSTSKLIDADCVSVAANAMLEKASRESGIGPSEIRVRIEKALVYAFVDLSNLYPFDKIARVKDQIRIMHNSEVAVSSHYGGMILSYEDTLLQDDRTLGSYGIRNGAWLVARFT